MVTELAKPQNKYQEAFRALKERKPTIAWVELVRESAMDRFELLGFPTVADEEWKYTNLAQVAKEQFLPTDRESKLIAKDIAQFSFAETNGSSVVLVHGVL